MVTFLFLLTYIVLFLGHFRYVYKSEQRIATLERVIERWEQD